MSFKDKTVMITGGTSGIGAETSKAFAKMGAKVIIVGRNEKKAQKIVEDINNNSPGEASYYICDLSQYDQVVRMRDCMDDIDGGIDVLFNNAGVFCTSDIENMDIEDWHRSFRINVDATMYMTKVFVDLIKKRKGCIINNASVSGMDSFVRGSKTYIYGATKAALIKFSKLCALNYAEEIRVNVVCPGIIDTEIYENRDFSRFMKDIPMKRIALPDAVSNAVLFLASDEAYYITGAVLPIDGGMSLV